MKQFIRYLTIGSLSVAIQFLLLTLFVELAQLIPTLASEMAFLIATVFNYIFQYYWNFKATGRHSSIFLRYCTVISMTAALNVSLFWLLNRLIGIWYLYAQCTVTLTVVIANFLLHRYYTFAKENAYAVPIE